MRPPGPRRPAFRRLGARRDALPRGGGQAPLQEAAHAREEDASLKERFPQLVDEPRAWPRRVPEPLSHAIMACLERIGRPATAGELALELQPLVGGLPAKLVLGRRGPIRA